MRALIRTVLLVVSAPWVIVGLVCFGTIGAAVGALTLQVLPLAIW